MTGTCKEDKRHRRPLLILGGLVLLLVGVLAYIVLFHDGPPPEDAHLMPTWSERGGNANPLAVFCKSLVGSSIKDWGKLPYESRRLDEKPTPEVRKFVAAHAAEIASFESLMLTDPNTWQWPDAEGAGKYEDPYTDRGASECDAMSLVLWSKALQLSEDGNTQEAIALCLRSARGADGLLGAEGGCIHLLVAQNFQHRSLRALQNVLHADAVSSAMLRDALLQLGTLKGPQTELFKKALKVDYAWMKDGTGNLSGRDLQAIGSLPRALRFLAPGYFKRNQTLNSRVQLDAPLMRALDQDWKSACSAMDAREAEVDDMYAPKSLACFMDPNFIGRSSVFYDLALPRIGHHWNKREELMLLLALRLHELEHG
ncbi:MAG: hypothetical protein ACAH88_20970, partial [Roseimicrobium sp.]